MTDEEKIHAARKELLQANCELHEAAAIIYGQNLPSVASLFEAAAKRKSELAKKMFPKGWAENELGLPPPK